MTTLLLAVIRLFNGNHSTSRDGVAVSYSNRSKVVIGDSPSNGMLGVKRAKVFGVRENTWRITGQPVNLNAAKKTAALEDKYTGQIILLSEQKVTEDVYSRWSLWVPFYLEVDASAAARASPRSYLRIF